MYFLPWCEGVVSVVRKQAPCNADVLDTGDMVPRLLKLDTKWR
jgi:hypothetical protein